MNGEGRRRGRLFSNCGIGMLWRPRDTAGTVAGRGDFLIIRVLALAGSNAKTTHSLSSS